MGLFDKLRNVVSGNQSESDPLNDVVVKNYFEIICGMSDTFGISVTKKVTGNEKAKKYVEYFLQNSCDEEKLEKALKLYNMSFEDYTSDETEIFLRSFRRSSEKEKRYSMDRHEAHKIFCQTEIENAAIELNQVIDVIKDNVNYRHFSQGVRKMPYSGAVKDIVITRSFCEGNPIIQKLILEYLTAIFVGRLENKTYNTLHNPRDDIALLAIKALNFEKYNGNPDEYKTAVEDDYRSFVLNVPYYSGVIDNNPFDKEKYITKFIKDIKSREIFFGAYSTIRDGFYLTCTDDYFCDFACYLMWKAVANVCNWQNSDGEYVSESKNMKDVFGMLIAYLENPDGFPDLTIGEEYSDDGDEYYEDDEEYCDDEEETGDVEVYDTTSDDVRSLLGVIDLED